MQCQHNGYQRQTVNSFRSCAVQRARKSTDYVGRSAQTTVHDHVEISSNDSAHFTRRVPLAALLVEADQCS